MTLRISADVQHTPGSAEGRALWGGVLRRMNEGVSRDRRTRGNDPIALERADPQHWSLEKAIVDLCAANGITPLTNRHVDLLAKVGNVSIIFEVKNCGPTEIGGPVRRAIYQLLEYRFLYRSELTSDVRLCVVSRRRPRGGVGWLMDYMEYMGIGIIWRNDGDSGLSCSDFTKTLLVDVLPQVAEWPLRPILWE